MSTSGKRAPDEGEASDEGQFESWLRKAARAPDSGPAVRLPLMGEVLGGKYRIEERLGTGGMGAVFRATHLVSEKSVAIKWMLRSASDEQASKRFQREARAAGRIEHPNVVDIYDVGQEGEWGYLVMELLRGESLSARLSRGRLAPVEAVDLLLPAMRGVAAAHRAGVIHRDLKPENIFLCELPDEGGYAAKVLDFGISSVTASDPARLTTLTKEGTLLGTPAYMSPEQLESTKDLDARTDVYAIGVILYEALTGSLPFQGDSYAALVLAIANKEPVPPRTLRPELSVELEQIVLRALSKARDARFASMQALIEALRPFASVSRSGDHVPAGLGRRTGPGRSLALGLGAVLLLAVLAWWLGGRDPQVPPTPQAAVASPAMQTPKPAPVAPAVAPHAPAASALPPEPAAVPAPTPATSASTTTPASQTREPSRRRATSVRAAPSPTPVAPAPAAPSADSKARSGRISLEDL